MSSNNNDDENIIKNKKNNENNGSNAFNFCISTLQTLLAIIIQFILGALILFGCKVAQSNVLPTDTKTTPYTDIDPNIQPIETNIFIKIFSGVSKKIKFPYKNDQNHIDNSKHMLINILRNEKQETKHATTNFFISLLEGLFSFNYSSITVVLQIINYFPEILILFFGPILFFIFSIILLVVNNIYLIYLWLFNLGWFFKTKRNGKWENVDDLFDYGWSMFVAFLFFILMWILLCLFIPFTFMSLFVFMWSFISIFSYEGIMDNKVVGMGSILIDVFKYYKTAFMSIFTFFFVINTFSMLGIIPGIFVILAILLIVFDYIKIDIFKPAIEENLSEIASTNKAMRETVPTQDQTGGSFLNNLIDDPKRMLKEIKGLKKETHTQKPKHVKNINNIQPEEYNK
jgi:hypothetical protein